MPERELLRLGTRGSRLALWQTDHVIAALVRTWPGLRCERVTLSTLGDRAADVPLPRVGDRGLFTRDIEQALREGAIDAAVHSLKDLPTEPPEGLELAAILERADPREALVSRSGARLGALPDGARVGTSSVRRRVQLLAVRPDLCISDIRGNVPTRIDKVSRGDYEAALLALAGLQRLGLAEVATEILEPHVIAPAPGQGALAVQVRAGDERVGRLVRALDHPPSRLATACERGVLSALHGGCMAPIGTTTRWMEDDVLEVRAVVGSFDGSSTLRATGRSDVRSEGDALALARRVAADLASGGADALLDACRRALRGAPALGGGA